MKTILIIALAVAAANAASLNTFETPNFPEGRIINGNESAVGAAPYIVSLRTNSHFCGGSIIDPNWVMTAGHCLVYSNFYIVAGLHDRNNETGTQVREVKSSKQYIVHEGYGGGVGPNDIGLIYVSPPFDLSASGQASKNRIGKIALPSANSTQTGKGVLYGWGRDNSGLLPNKLNYLDVDIINYTQCKQNLPFLAPIDPVNICTYTANKADGACNGDSGGPLVKKNSKSDVQVGIVSWGYTPCATTKYPSVYTRVSAYLDWIENKQNNFEVMDILI